MKVDHRHVGRGHANGGAVELSVELGQDQADGARGAGRGRDHGQGGGAGPVQVLVQGVLHRLVTGIGMDCGHEAFDDADLFVQDRGDRREAIGGAGGVRHDAHSFSQFVVIDAVDDGEVGSRGRRRDQDAFRAALQMHFRLFALGENAGAVHHHVNAKLAPGKLRRVALGKRLDGVAIDADRRFEGLDAPRKRPVHRIVAQ